MSIVPSTLRTRFARFTLPLLATVCVSVSLGAGEAQAAGSSKSNTALQVSVEVIRSCAVDTNAARRDGLVLATQSALAASCGAPARVVMSDVQLNLIQPQGTLPRLDVEF